MNQNTPKFSLFPLTTQVKNKHLYVGNCDIVELAREYGTPLYVFDEFTIRAKCREFKKEFAEYYPNTVVAYASKAFINRYFAQILKEEEMGLDVVSGGELFTAQSVEFPTGKIYFHGNNKTLSEIELALNLKVGRIIADNFYELEIINRLADKLGIRQNILLRLAPGVDAHTHRHTTTGLLDSKFGFSVDTGQAEQAIAKAISMQNLDLVGLHFHLGSPVPETYPYTLAIDRILRFAKEMMNKYSFQLQEFSPGGGFPVRYTTDQIYPGIAEYAKAIADTLKSVSSELSLSLPKLIVEPGRSIVAQAGIALYTVGAIKDIPGIRKYICIDGGMGDNIRPALYDARYEALVANRTDDDESIKVSIAGKYCESGDIIVKDICLPDVKHGDIIAVPVNGAYAIPMSSNYNMVPRPAIIMVKDDNNHLIRKRETYQDLIRLDLLDH